MTSTFASSAGRLKIARVFSLISVVPSRHLGVVACCGGGVGVGGALIFGGATVWPPADAVGLVSETPPPGGTGDDLRGCTTDAAATFFVSAQSPAAAHAASAALFAAEAASAAARAVRLAGSTALQAAS